MITQNQLEQNRKEIKEFLTSTKRKGIENLIEFLDRSNFFVSPASTMFHGNFEGGLAYHSLEVYKAFKRNLQNYPLAIPQETQIISGICHDFCKINYYIKNTLKKGNISEAKPYKVDESFPYGHGEKSVLITSRYIPLTNQEAMIIRWHMTNEDKAWEDYKERVEKLYPEVVIFNHADKEVSLIKRI